MNIKSEKAREFIEKWCYTPNDDVKEKWIEAVKIAEEEMKQKAIVEFCKTINCPYLNDYECMSIIECTNIKYFINQLNS